MWSEILKHKEIFPHFFFNIFGLQDSHIGRGEEGGICRPLVFQSIRGRLLPVTEEGEKLLHTVLGGKVSRPGSLLLPLILPVSVVLDAASVDQETDFKAISENV